MTPANRFDAFAITRYREGEAPYGKPGDPEPQLCYNCGYNCNCTPLRLAIIIITFALRRCQRQLGVHVPIVLRERVSFLCSLAFIRLAWTDQLRVHSMRGAYQLFIELAY